MPGKEKMEISLKDVAVALVVVVAFFGFAFFCMNAHGEKEAEKLGQYVLEWKEQDDEVRTMYFTPTSIDTDTRYQEFYTTDDTTITVSRGVCCVEKEDSESKSVMILTNFEIRPVDNQLVDTE